MEKKKIDHNSIENMRIKEKLVDREVNHCCNYMISSLLKTDLQDQILEKFYSEYDEETESYFEPFEFWIVSDWLGEKLKDQGQLVDVLFDFTIWARGTAGQAIALDYVISRIAEDMQILDGQKYSWANSK